MFGEICQVLGSFNQFKVGRKKGRKERKGEREGRM